MRMLKNRTSKIIVIIIAVLLLGAVGFFAFRSYTDHPQNLGPQIEYIGKRHTGCPLPLPLGYLIMCSSEPGEEYYFGTDLSVEELRGYFGGAKAIDSDSSISGTAANYNYYDVGFTAPNGSFTVLFYDSKEGVLQTFNLKTTTKKNIISIDKEDYQEAKNAL